MRWFVLLLLLVGTAQTQAQQAEPAHVPYRLTDTHHVLVRLKINGKGPFNVIVDTGCPVFIVSAAVGKQLGLTSDDKGWATIDRLEFEGGLSQARVKARIETPFQIEGMNSMGLAGVELHGLLGCSVLAKYRMQLDFTRDRMHWTPLAFQPPEAHAFGKAPTASIDMMAGLVRIVAALIGNQAAPAPQTRGFFGFELTQKDGAVAVERVLPRSPAAQAGLKSGDAIESVDGHAIKSIDEVLAGAARVTPGRTLRLSLMRDGVKVDLRITAGEGL